GSRGAGWGARAYAGKAASVGSCMSGFGTVHAMRTRLLAVLLLLLLGAGLAAQRPLDLAGLWTQLTDEDRLWQPAGPGEVIVVASSRDRRSDQGPEVPDDWFADEDVGRFVRVD